MRKGGGAKKGPAFERKLCVKLSLWASKGDSRDWFWRTAGSGARATSAIKRGHHLRQTGDVTATDPAAQEFSDRFFLELKHLRDFEWERLVEGRGHLLEVWKKVRRQAKAHRRYPLLIGKQNHRVEFLGLEASRVYSFRPGLVSDLPCILCPPCDLWMTPLDGFLRLVSADELLAGFGPSSDGSPRGRVPVGAVPEDTGTDGPGPL